MRIVGIDPGTGITGFGIIDNDNGQQRLVDAGVIKTTPRTPPAERLKTTYDNICEVLDETKPHIMAIEKLFFAQNVTTAMSVSQSRGVLLLAAEQRGIGIYEYTPLQIKMAITGYGRAEKQQMQEMVRVLLSLKTIPKPDDCADALAAALCHVSIARVQAQ